jgi:oligopeptide transport system substrate-binding protein
MNILKLNFQEGDLPSLHPHAVMIYLRGITVAKNLYECLTRINSQGKPQLAGAEAVDISPDRLHYTFRLRDNKWSNGMVITAYHYENAWKETLSPTSNSSRADLLYMIKNAEQAKKGEISLEDVGVKALDAKTLTVELAYPSPYFLEMIAQSICAPLMDVKQKEPREFSGPFMVDEWRQGHYLSLKRNPYYWDRKHISLQQIDIYMIQNPMTAFAMYENNQIDWIGVPLVPLPSEIINDLQKNNELKSQPVVRVFWIFLNTQHPCLSSASLRQAFSLAVDREAITKHIFVGAHPLEKPFPSTLLPIPISSPLEENLIEAKQKFEIGLKELGLTRDTFECLEITYSQQPGRKQLAAYLQQVWSKAFGINIKIVPKEWNILRKNLENGNYQISGCFEFAIYNDPAELMDKFVSLNSSNFPKWMNKDFKDKVNRAKQEANLDKRMKQLSEAEQILAQQLPFIPICNDEFLFAHHPKLKGYVFDFVGACDFSRASINVFPRFMIELLKDEALVSEKKDFKKGNK